MSFNNRKYNHKFEVGAKVIIAKDIPEQENKGDIGKKLTKFKGKIGVITFCRKEVVTFGYGEKYLCGVQFDEGILKLFSEYFVLYGNEEQLKLF